MYSSPTSFKAFMNNLEAFIGDLRALMKDLVIALEAGKQGVMGENKVSGLMFADVFVGISDTAGVQKHV